MHSQEAKRDDASAIGALDFAGITLAVFPGVYGPREDSELLASAVARLASGRFLDLGCGTGMQGITASRSPKVSSVSFADISPLAVSCAQFNASSNRIPLPNSFIRSDLFSGLGGEPFDTIAFNPPYLPTSRVDRVAGALNSALDGGPSGRKVTDRFLKEFPSHLAADGVMLLVDSSLARFEKSVRFLESRGYCAEIAASRRFFFEEVVVIKAARA
ncbi:MAG: HemK2/MTQ2 family protein methyltransferase [Candidatus Micrarchaeota archaeon]